MEKIYPSVGDVISPVVPKATLSASIELSYDDLKEISKAFSRVNKALDKKMKSLGPDSGVSQEEIVGDVVDTHASSGRLAGLSVVPVKELVLSNDFSAFKQDLKDEIECYGGECRDKGQPLVTFYALNGKKVRSRLETWIPKLFAIESWWTSHLCGCQNSTYIQVLFFVFLRSWLSLKNVYLYVMQLNKKDMGTKEKNLIFVARCLGNGKIIHYSLDEVSVLAEDILVYAEALREKRDNRLKNGLYRYDYVNIAPDILYKLNEENKLKLASSEVLLALGQGADFFPLVCEIKNIQSKLGMGKIGNSGQLELSSEAPLFNTWITRLLPKRN